MPIWRLKLLLLAITCMLVQGGCLAQTQPGAAAPGDPVPNPRGAASVPLRGGSPTPYRAPISVPSAAGNITPLQLPTPNTAVAPPSAPNFTGNCDTAGCWGADGTRYNAIGGSLVRPDGRLCQNVAGVMQCQ